MPKNLNRLSIVGRLGDFPEMRYTANGLAVTRISLGVSNDRFDKDTEEWEERTDWIPVTFFGFKAENLAERINKGDLLYVECRVSNNKFDKEGVTVYTFNFIGDTYERMSFGNHTRDEEEEEEDDNEDGMAGYDNDDEEEEEEVVVKKSRKKTRKATPKFKPMTVKELVDGDEEDDDDIPPF